MIWGLLNYASHLQGQIDAILYSRKGADALPDDGNEHEYLVRLRFVQGALPALALLVHGYCVGILFGSPLLAFLLMAVDLAAWVFSFSFFHNRAYYLMRDTIDSTNHGPKYQSPTDTAKRKFNYVQRRNKLYISIGIFVAGYSVLWIVFNVIM